jgi:hypothetical protein
MRRTLRQLADLTRRLGRFAQRIELRSWRLCCLVLVSTLLLSSCSSTKMGYELLDWAAMWKINRMVDLHSTQRDQAKAEVRAVHEWHRRTQLPRYADYLEAMRQRLKIGSITAEQLHEESDNVQLMLDDVLNKALPPATQIISTLSDKQVAGMLENIAEEREEYVEEYIEPGVEKRQEKNAKDLRDHLKRFLGSLTKEQDAWIDAWSKELLPYAHLSAKQQALWQEHLAKYLALRENQTLLEQGLRELMVYRSDNWHPELKRVVDANQVQTYKLLAKVLNNLTAKQQQHLNKRLDDYIQDFRALARK